MQDYAQAKVFYQIPVIDVAPLLAGQDSASVATQFHDAATEVGFFYISGHGISQTIIDQAFQTKAGFFALPDAQKSTIAVNQHQRGWMAQGMSRLSGSMTHDP